MPACTCGSSGGTSTTRNNYLSAATQDSYNLERYDFGRGPNAALFNIGANSALGGGMGHRLDVAVGRVVENEDLGHGLLPVSEGRDQRPRKITASSE